MEDKPIMLIVDDAEINRVLLSQFFQGEYRILEATDGKEALELLASCRVNIVLVELIMPVMDGFELIAALRRSDAYTDVPIIAMTGKNDGDNEARAMEMGAADFITKPFNPTIVRSRVKNVMARLENEWRKLEQAAKDRQLREMHRYIERDALTGLYNRETFYRKAASLMQAMSGTSFDIVYFDISCFKVINDLFQTETGNLILKTAAYYFQAIIGEEGIVGRIEADHFAICIPSNKLHIGRLMEGLDNTMQSLGISHNVMFFAGIYPVSNAFLPVDQMCDRAHMALNKVKGNYMTRYAYYDKSMRDLMLQEQMIVRDMELALQEKQFCIYLQPIYNLKTNKIVSAEALVRWNHPVNGTISPAHFVPVFERNGFIVRLDRFVWEEVCRFLKRQKNNGAPLVPVSVNVSRLHFYNMDLLDFLMRLLEQYELTPDLLKLEITESAYTENPHQITSVIKEFRAKGFRILMDDFGSGYSSLNMLKNMPVDILKIDMAFVQEVENSPRANAILRFMLELSDALNMGVVVEGVETKPQIDILAGLGCEDIQGFYFSRPLPVPDFRTLLEKDA